MDGIKDMSPEEALVHYGVLGMKWGKTRARATPVQVRAARTRVGTQSRKVGKAAEKAAYIKDPKERAKAERAVGRMKTDFLNNPDRVTAARMTTGEKHVALVLSLTGLPGVTAIAVTSARSRRIERKQETGAYNKR